MDSELRAQKANRITIQGAVLNLLLLAAKFTAGILGRSQAMMADAVHTCTDFATDIIVFIGIHLGKKPRDKDHPFGHGKYETIAAVIIAIALGGIGIKIGYDGLLSMYRVFFEGFIIPQPHVIAFIAALVSVIAKEILYRLTKKVGIEIDSPAVIANAWHHRSDALSSVGTTLGIGGAVFLGKSWTILDPLAAAVVSIFILKAAWQILLASIADLTDTAVKEETQKEIANCITAIKGVSDPHNIWARKVGSCLVIDAHIRVDSEVSVRAGHEIATKAETALRAQFGKDTIVTIHVEPMP